MGYALVMSECAGCHRVFGYNHKLVPSITIAGVKQPICLDCVHAVNPKRIKNGLQPIIPHRDAYNPVDESELDLD